MGLFSDTELERAGFPSGLDKLVFAAPIEGVPGFSSLAAGALEFDLIVTLAPRPSSIVDTIVKAETMGYVSPGESTRIAVGYLPSGPITAGEQTILYGEKRVFRKQMVKAGGVLVVALADVGAVQVHIEGAGAAAVPELPAAGKDPAAEFGRGLGESLGTALGIGLIAFLAYQLLLRKL